MQISSRECSVCRMKRQGSRPWLSLAVLTLSSEKSPKLNPRKIAVKMYLLETRGCDLSQIANQ